MRAIFTRHGENTGNAGIPSYDLAQVELTELGWSQSREVAASWIEAPDLIVTSPFLRTQQTAAATIERFPNAPVEIWPIEEFTYLQPERWNGTRSSERMPFLERYWSACEPEYCDGEGAESFSALLGRALATLGRLETLPADSLVYLFSHGQFIRAVRSVVSDTGLNAEEKMRQFWGKSSSTIPNAARVALEWQGKAWRPGDPLSS